jgi:hypothetical protein
MHWLEGRGKFVYVLDNNLNSIREEMETEEEEKCVLSYSMNKFRLEAFGTMVLCVQPSFCLILF